MIGRLGKIAALLLVACVGVVAFGAATAAADFTVNTLEDGSESIYGCSVNPTCSLRDAIEHANESEGPDTIKFSVAGVIHLEDGILPYVEGPTTIDATTAPGYEGSPVVEVDGSETSNEGAVDGLHTHSELNVYGLAIGGFENAVFDHATKQLQLCGDYLGVELDGVTARPNQVGVWISSDSEGELPAGTGSEIGVGCGSLPGNLISGNTAAGILDEGSVTLIGGNRIGLDAVGDPLPNGYESPPPFGGILVAGTAIESTIGTYFDGEEFRGSANEIAYNHGPGVWIESSASKTWVRGNSIFDNEGLGIEVDEDPSPAPPTITSVDVAGGETTVSGTVEPSESEYGSLEFFAGETCDPSGAGEGEFFLGGGEYEPAVGTESRQFKVGGLSPPPPGATVITATATAIEGSTSEFSTCFALPKPPPSPKPEEKVAAKTDSGPIPVNGKTLVADPTQGTIRVKLPGSKKYVDLSALKSIPSGSIVDATKGKVTITSVNAAGEEQSATFYGGVFQVIQKPGATIVLLILKGGDFKSCKAGKTSSSSALASGRAGRHLWGSGKGHFKTEGNHGTATVRGTIWFTEDRCDSTFFKVKRGIVSVRDFDAHRTVSVKAGKTYTAGP